MGWIIPLLLALTLASAALSQSKPPAKVQDDEHILLCHTDWLRFYRVEQTERSQQGKERKTWTRWTLIDDRRPKDKQEIDDQLKFYRENHIKIEYHAIEGSLP